MTSQLSTTPQATVDCLAVNYPAPRATGSAVCVDGQHTDPKEDIFNTRECHLGVVQVISQDRKLFNSSSPCWPCVMVSLGDHPDRVESCHGNRAV